MEAPAKSVSYGVILGMFTVIVFTFLVAFPDGNQSRVTTDIADNIGVASLNTNAEPEYLAYSAGFRPGNYKVIGLDDQEKSDTNPFGYEPIDPDDVDKKASDDEDGDEDEDEDADEIAEANFDGELEAGLYATSFTTAECSYELWSNYVAPKKSSRSSRYSRWSSRTSSTVDEDDVPDEIIVGADQLDGGRLLVTINELEPDRFWSQPECGEWVKWSQVAEPLEAAKNGDYWVGDLAEGVWQTPAGCYWEKVLAFRGGELGDVQESGIGGVFEVDENTYGVRLRNCNSSAELTDLPLTIDLLKAEASKRR